MQNCVTEFSDHRSLKVLELHFDGCPVDVCGIVIRGFFSNSFLDDE